MKSIKTIVLSFFMLMTGLQIKAQISPPGLGNSKTASWLAAGVRKTLDSTGNKQALTYFGMGRISGPEASANPFKKQAIFVLNHEIYNRYAENWQYSYALSYRRQTNYEDEAPYSKEGVEQEFRIYGRYSYILGNSKWKWTNTVRQEFRKYFTADFTKADENLQLRTRLKSQLAYSLGAKGQKLLLSAEALFATSLMNEPRAYWTTYQYKESRFALYYAFKIPNSPFSMDVGYMNDLIRKSDKPIDVHYIAADLTWNIPYSKKH